MVSSLIIVAVLVAVGLGIVGFTQGEHIQGFLQDSLKPSATECEFSGQRLSEDYYCVWKQSNGRQYLEIEKITENQIPICSGVSMQGARIDANGVGSFTLVKDSGCIDTVKTITAGGYSISPNYELKLGDTKIPISYDIGAKLPEGKSVTVGISMQGLSSSVTSTTVLPAGSVESIDSSKNIQQQQTYSVIGGKEISPFQRIFVKELFNGEIQLTSNLGISTSNAKALSITIDGDIPVEVTIDGTSCLITGSSFERLCDIPSNSNINLVIAGNGKTHAIVKLHYIF